MRRTNSIWVTNIEANAQFTIISCIPFRVGTFTNIWSRTNTITTANISTGAFNIATIEFFTLFTKESL